MDNIELRTNLIESLTLMYEMEAIGDLAEFLQGELHVLQFMSTNKNMEINPSILSDKLHVSRPRITAALSALSKKGYVTMENSDEDRRRIKVLLTQNGEDLLIKKRENIENYFDILIAGLGEKNVVDLIRLIDLSGKIMNKAEKL